MHCAQCGEQLTSTHVALRIEFVGGSPAKNAMARRVALTHGVPGVREPLRLCLGCGVAQGKLLRSVQDED